MEFAAIKKLREDVRDLALDDARTIIFDNHTEPILLHINKFDGNLWQDLCLFAGIKCIVDGLFDCCKKGLPLVIKAEQVAVLLEEFGNGNFSLLLGKLLRLDVLLLWGTFRFGEGRLCDSAHLENGHRFFIACRLYIFCGV